MKRTVAFLGFILTAVFCVPAAAQEDTSAAFAQATYVPEELQNPQSRQRDPSPGPDAILVKAETREGEEAAGTLASRGAVDPAEAAALADGQALPLLTPRSGTADYEDDDSFEDRLSRSILEPIRDGYLPAAQDEPSS